MSVAPDSPLIANNDSFHRVTSSLVSNTLSATSVNTRARVSLKSFRSLHSYLTFYALLTWRRGYPYSLRFYRIHWLLLVVFVYVSNIVSFVLRRNSTDAIDPFLMPIYILAYWYGSAAWFFGLYYMYTFHDAIEKLLRTTSSDERSAQRLIKFGRIQGRLLHAAFIVFLLCWVATNIIMIALHPTGYWGDYLWYLTRFLDVLGMQLPSFVVVCVFSTCSAALRILYDRIRLEKTYSYHDHTYALQFDNLVFSNTLKTYIAITVLVLLAKIGLVINTFASPTRIPVSMPDQVFRIMDGLIASSLPIAFVLPQAVMKIRARNRVGARLDAGNEAALKNTLSATSVTSTTSFAARRGAAILLGDKVPNFTQNSSMGPITLYDYQGDSWLILFSHPADFTPVCTTELGAAAKLMNDFGKRNVKVLALSVDSVENHLKWIKDIEETQDCKVTFPIIADEDRSVAGLYSMAHPNAPLSLAGKLTVRSVFIIGPDKSLKLTLTYPAPCGRNFDEILRTVDSLQMTMYKKCATPANWEKGGDVVILPAVTKEEADASFPGYRTVKPYLRFTNDPTVKTPLLLPKV